MSTDTEVQQPEVAEARSLGHRLAAPWRAMRRRPVRSAILMGAALVVVVLAAVAGGYVEKQKEKKQIDFTIHDALEQLAQGNDDEARKMAVRLKASGTLPYEDLGGPAYILGVVLARDGDSQWHEQEKRTLYGLAARYLVEAVERGAPAGHEAEADYLLGRCLHETQRFAQAIPYLLQALDAGGPRTNELIWRLSTAYFSDSPRDLEQALSFADRYLESDELTAEQRHAAELHAARILLAQNDLDGSRERLEQIPEDADVRSDVLVMQARLLMAEAARIQRAAAADNSEPGEPVAEQYAEALKLLRLAQTHDELGSPSTRRSQYLIGVCYSELGNFEAAAKQFSMTRRLYPGTPEELAASLGEAESLRQNNLTAEALLAYETAIRDGAARLSLGNPWFTESEFRERIYSGYVAYRDAAHFQNAIRLAEMMPPLFPRDESVQLQAEAYEKWAEDLDRQIKRLPAHEQGLRTSEARSKWRQAANLYVDLSRLRFATREYPEYLWRSCEGFINGRDYRRAVTLLRDYLQQEPRRRRPRTLVALGESLLALGRVDESLAPLNECIQFYPKHPDSYRARLILAQAHVEEGRIEAAKSLLLDNIENEALTPDSVEWRDSLFTLGMVYYRLGLKLDADSRVAGIDGDYEKGRMKGLQLLADSYDAHQEAIKILTETVERHRHDLKRNDPKAHDPRAIEQVIRAKYLIAESHRHSARWPRKKLPTVIVATTRTKLERQVQSELQTAIRYYDEILLRLNEKLERASTLSEIEERILRNSYFARANSLFDMGQNEAAVQAYSNATNRYLNQPEALEALVQMAACYRNLNRPDEARGQLEQAKLVLKRLPPNLPLEETTRYTRTDWNRLLTLLTAF